LYALVLALVLATVCAPVYRSWDPQYVILIL
jgi:hypothetical protein